MKIKKGDTVLIITGKDKGKKGKVLKSLPKKERIVVEGVNLMKKHQKPRKAGEKGQMVSLSMPLHISNTKLICPKCGKAARVGYKIMNSADKSRKIKIRVCKKCGQEI